MKKALSIIGIVLGVAVMLYGGAWVMFYGGIVQVVNGIKSDLDGMIIALGVIRVMLTGLVVSLGCVIFHSSVLELKHINLENRMKRESDNLKRR